MPRPDCCPAARRSTLAAGVGIAAGVAFFGGLLAAAPADPAPAGAGDAVTDTVLDHKVKTLDGAETDLARYRGDVVLIVNVASKCGYTGQYKPLQAAYEKYRERGFVILAFPCNQFGGQEPGGPAEIAAFCDKNYGVTFPLMGKVEVKGDGADPLYKELTAAGATADPGPVKWNFEKFLIGRDGRPIARFRREVDPASEQMTAAIEKALDAPAPDGEQAAG